MYLLWKKSHQKVANYCAKSRSCVRETRELMAAGGGCCCGPPQINEHIGNTGGCCGSVNSSRAHRTSRMGERIFSNS